MNRKLVLAIAVSSAFAAMVGSAYAKQAVSTDLIGAQYSQIAPNALMTLPLYVAEGEDDKKPESTQLIAEGEDDKKPESTQLIAEGEDDKKPESTQLIAEGEDDKKPESTQLIAEGEDDKKPESTQLIA